MKKRVLSILLTLVMVLTMLPVLEVPARAAEDYRYWSQGDPRWAHVVFGEFQTMSGAGCFITSVTKLMIQYGLRSAEDFNPGEFAKFYNNKTYNGAPVISHASTSLDDGNLSIENLCHITDGMEFVKYDGGPYNSKGVRDMDQFMVRILGYLQENQGVFLPVPGHFIAVDGLKSLQTGEVYIMDSKSTQTNADVRLVDTNYYYTVEDAGVIQFNQGPVGLGYLGECTFYPSYGKVTTPKKVAIKSLPCSSGTDKESVDLAFAAPGQQFTTIGIYKNTVGNYWYQLDGFQNVDGESQKAFIYGGDASFKKLPDDVNVTEKKLPETLEQGGGFYLGGKVTSEYSPITWLQASITDATGKHPYYQRDTKVSRGDYNLESSYLDDGMAFSKLIPGNYRFRLYGTCSRYHLEGQKLVDDSKNQYLIDQAFTVTPAPAAGYARITSLGELNYLLGTAIAFDWEVPDNANACDLVIEMRKGDDLYEPWKTFSDVKPPQFVELPEGSYRARVHTRNAAGTTEGANEWFSVIPESKIEVMDIQTMGDHRYQAILVATDVAHAQEVCKRRGGHLATISSAEENQMVSTTYQPYGTLMLGLSDTKTEGSFQWVTGEPVTYTNWADGQPDNARDLEDQVVVDVTTGQWFDTFYQHYFVCEYECMHEKIEPCPEIPPTCTREGQKACYRCVNCEQLYLDAAGTQKADPKQLAIAPLGHSYQDGLCIRCEQEEPGQWWHGGSPSEENAWSYNRRTKTLEAWGSGSILAVQNLTSPNGGTQIHFRDLPELAHVILREGISQVYLDAFAGCPSLQDVTMPLSMESLNRGAFKDTPLQWIEYQGIQREWDQIFIESGAIPEGVEIRVQTCPHVRRELVYESIRDGMHQKTERCARCLEVFSQAEEACVDADGDSICDLCKNRLPYVIGSGSCGGEAGGTNVTWEYWSDGVLRFIGSGPMTAEYPGSPPWLQYNGTIREVSIQSGITTVSAGAFRMCEILKEVVLPNTVTAIGAYTFADCPALERLILSKNLQALPYSCLQNCTALRELHLDGKELKVDVNFAPGCLALEHITVGPGVRTIPAMTFMQMEKLQQITVSPENPWYQSQDGVLFSARPTGELDLLCYPRARTERVYTVPAAVIDLESHSLFGNPHLEEVVLLSAPGYAFRIIDQDCFRCCKALKKITIPLGKCSILQSAFEQTALTEVWFGGQEEHWKQIQVTPEGNERFLQATVHYASCPHTRQEERYATAEGQTHVKSWVCRSCGEVVRTETQACTDDNHNFLCDYCGGPVACAHGAVEERLTCNQDHTHTIRTYCQYCGQEVGTPRTEPCIGYEQDGVCDRCGGIYPQNAESGFCGGEGDGTNLRYTLTTQGKLTITGSGAMGQAPWDSRKITSVSLPEGLTTISGYAFQMSKLTEVILPDTVHTIGNGAFRGSPLTALQLPQKMELIGGYAFAGCDALPSVHLPQCTVMGEGAFVNGPQKLYCCFAPPENLEEILGPDAAEPATLYYAEQAASWAQHTLINGTIVPWDPAEHASQLEQIVPPTCVRGYTRYVCPRCGFHYDTEFTEPVQSHTLRYAAEGDKLVEYCANGCDYQETAQLKLNGYYFPAGQTAVTPGQILYSPGWQGGTLTIAYENNLRPGTASASIEKNGAVLKQCFEICRERVVDQGVCGPDLRWVLYEDNRLLISGTGPMDNWNLADSLPPWYVYSQANDANVYLEYVIVSEGVTTLGDHAFCCPGVRNIILPQSLKSIGFNAIDTNLQALYLPDGVQTMPYLSGFDLEQLSLGTALRMDRSDLRNRTNLKHVYYAGTQEQWDQAGYLLPTGCQLHLQMRGGKLGRDVGQWTFDQTTGTLEIDCLDSSSQILRAIPLAEWNHMAEEIRHLRITNGSLDPEQLRRYPNLETVQMSDYTNVDGVLYSQGLRNLVFCLPTKAGALDLPQELEAIGKDAFYGCRKLTSVTFHGQYAPDDIYPRNYAFFPDTPDIEIHVPYGSTGWDKKKWAVYNIVVDSPITVAAATQTGQELQIQVEKSETYTDCSGATVLCAIYDDAGRFLGCQEVPADQNTVTFRDQQEAASVMVYAMDQKNGVPLAEKAEQEISSEHP